MAAAFDEVIGPAAERFQPDIILVRAALLNNDGSARMEAYVARMRSQYAALSLKHGCLPAQF